MVCSEFMYIVITINPPSALNVLDSKSLSLFVCEKKNLVRRTIEMFVTWSAQLVWLCNSTTLVVRQAQN